MPHELDVHPDCDKIRATIAADVEPLEEEIRTLQSENEEADHNESALKEENEHLTKKVENLEYNLSRINTLSEPIGD